jgi:hypothetical protein
MVSRQYFGYLEMAFFDPKRSFNDRFRPDTGRMIIVRTWEKVLTTHPVVSLFRSATG